MIEIKKIEEDSRGCDYSGSFKGKEFLMFYLKKGAPKGGHYHNKKCVHFIIFGKLKLRCKGLNHKKETIRTVKSGDVVVVKPKVIHLFVAKEDSLLLEIKERGLQTFKYEPYRKLINAFIRKMG